MRRITINGAVFMFMARGEKLTGAMRCRATAYLMGDTSYGHAAISGMCVIWWSGSWR